MPKFTYSDINFDAAPVGVYVAQVTNAIKTVSKNSGNDMIVLNLRTIPDGYLLKYYLVFKGTKQSNGIITKFCRNCEGELTAPKESGVEFSLTPADALYRIVFIDVAHENDEGEDEPRAKIKFGGILSRAKALARAPELANVKLPANVPPPRALAIMPAEEKPAQAAGDSPTIDDDIPF
jgi:hypothetical protein